MENRRSSKDIFLKSTSDYKKLIQKGLRFYANDWLIFNYKKSEQGHFRLGFTLSRFVGSAVIRNKLKRWCREFAREYFETGKAPDFDVNLFFKRKEKIFYQTLTYKTFCLVLEKGFDKISK